MARVMLPVWTLLAVAAVGGGLVDTRPAPIAWAGLAALAATGTCSAATTSGRRRRNRARLRRSVPVRARVTETEVREVRGRRHRFGPERTSVEVRLCCELDDGADRILVTPATDPSRRFGQRTFGSLALGRRHLQLASQDGYCTLMVDPWEPTECVLSTRPSTVASPFTPFSIGPTPPMVGSSSQLKASILAGVIDLG